MDEAGIIGTGKQAAGVFYFRHGLHSAAGFNAGPGCDSAEINTSGGMAGLIAGLLVMAIIDANDRQVWRFGDSNRR